MLSLTKAMAISGLIVFSSSCATIVSKTKYPVTINTTPVGADVHITNRKGTEVFVGKTPAIVNLKSGGGFFQNARYQVQLTKDSFTSKTVELRATINGWYFGNLLLGGLLGLLIIDPATGAMYKLKETDVNETLVATNTTAQHELRIYDLNQIPEGWKNRLVALK